MREIYIFIIRKTFDIWFRINPNGWKIVPNEENVQCDHRFVSQPLANEPFHSSQLFDTSLQKSRSTCRALSEGLFRKVVTNARVRLQGFVTQNGGHIEHVLR